MTKLQYSIKVPLGYDKILAKGNQYLSQHKDLIPRKNVNVVFISDVFVYALDLLADHLEIDIKVEVDEEEIEFVPPVKNKDTYEEELWKDKHKRKEEYNLYKSLSEEQKEEYNDKYNSEGVSVSEYLAIKEALD
jgi:hypothetical protein